MIAEGLSTVLTRHCCSTLGLCLINLQSPSYVATKLSMEIYMMFQITVSAHPVNVSYLNLLDNLRDVCVCVEHLNRSKTSSQQGAQV